MQKERYVTKETIKAETADWLSAVERETGKRRTNLPVGKRGLLVVDMQRFFTQDNARGFVPSVDAISPQINHAIDLAREQGMPIALTRHAHKIGDKDYPFDFFWRNLLMEEDELSAIDERIEHHGFPIFTKRVYSAFRAVGFSEWMASEEIELLLLAGVTTHICIETTARHAFISGVFPVVLADATAAWNKRQHLGSLVGMSESVARILSVEEAFSFL